MSDWEDEDNGKSIKPLKKEENDDGDSVHGFSDEDEDENALLGDDWDAEEKPAEVKTEAPVKPKALSKRMMEKKREEALKKAREQALEEESDPAAALEAKLRAQKAIEQADMENAVDLFGGGGGGRGEGSAAANIDPMAVSATTLQQLAPIIKQGGVEDYKLDSDEDWEKFGDEILKRISTCKQSSIEKFMCKLIKDGTKAMRLENFDNIKKIVTVVATEKQKAQQNKKKTNSKPALGKGVGKGGSDIGLYEDMGGVGETRGATKFDTFDDFM